MIRSVLRRLGIGGTAPSSAKPTDHVKRFGPFVRFTITDEKGEPYLTRWYLFKKPWLKIYLHQIHQSDGDRELHDHPWPFVSFLLWGPGYTEHQPDGTTKYFSPFSINARLDAAKPHRLVVGETSPPQWTLMFVGCKRREWGFHVPHTSSGGVKVAAAIGQSRYVENAAWVNHRVFLDNKFGEGQWTEEPDYYEETIRA